MPNQRQGLNHIAADLIQRAQIISKFPRQVGPLATFTCEVAASAADVFEGLRVVAVDELLLGQDRHLTRVHGVDALRDAAACRDRAQGLGAGLRV